MCGNPPPICQSGNRKLSVINYHQFDMRYWLGKASRCQVTDGFASAECVAHGSAVRTVESSECLFTYFLKSSFVLGQLLLTENAVLGQKVDCREKKKKKQDKLSESWGNTGPLWLKEQQLFPVWKIPICFVLPPPRAEDFQPEDQHRCVSDDLEQ